MKQTRKRMVSNILAAAMLLTASLTPSGSYADEPLPRPEITYGQALQDAPLLEGTVNGVPGTWTWADPSIKPSAGTQNFDVLFTPKDTGNYNTTTASIPVTTRKDIPQIVEYPTPGTITYGRPLSDVLLAGGIAQNLAGEEIPGTWHWDEADKDKIPDPDAGMFEAVFTPDDTDNYEETRCAIMLTIEPAELDPENPGEGIIITPPTAADITYGQTLADSALSGGSVTGIDGIWAWESPEAKPNRYDNPDYSKTFTYNVVFTPAKNYKPFTMPITVTLQAASPIVETVPSASELLSGESLNAASLSGGKVAGVDGEELAGIWMWQNGSTVPEAGITEQTAEFLPDSLNYGKVSAEVPVTVKKGGLIVETQPSAGNIRYGQSLSESAITGGTVQNAEGQEVSGTWQWKDGSITPNAGTQNYEAVFTPDDSGYSGLSVTIQVTVEPAAIDPGDPVYEVRPPSAADITYGQTLAESVLAGGNVAGVEGKWSWKEPDTQPPAGKALYQVVFTPADPNLSGFTVGIYVTVGKATLIPEESELPKASDIIYGQSLKDSYLTAGNTVQDAEGKWQWTDESIEPNAGETEYPVSFVPAEDGYLPLEVSVPVKTEQAEPEVQAGEVTVKSGTKLSEAVVDYTAIGVKGEELSGSFF